MNSTKNRENIPPLLLCGSTRAASGASPVSTVVIDGLQENSHELITK